MHAVHAAPQQAQCLRHVHVLAGCWRMAQDLKGSCMHAHVLDHATKCEVQLPMQLLIPPACIVLSLQHVSTAELCNPRKLRPEGQRLLGCISRRIPVRRGRTR